MAFTPVRGKLNEKKNDITEFIACILLSSRVQNDE